MYFYEQAKAYSNKVRNIIVVGESEETINLKIRTQEIYVVQHKSLHKRQRISLNKRILQKNV